MPIRNGIAFHVPARRASAAEWANPADPILETNDRDSIAEVLAGDPERFHDLVRRHSAPLWGTIRSAVSNAEDAREVLQETWLRAFERLHTLREHGRFRAWLLSIALNQVRQALRRRGLVESEPVEHFDGGLDPARSVEERAACSEEAEVLRGRIATLPARQREVLDLRLNHELSHGEIAEVLGITPESSRANYYQAVRKLRAVDDAPTQDSR